MLQVMLRLGVNARRPVTKLSRNGESEFLSWSLMTSADSNVMQGCHEAPLVSWSCDWAHILRLGLVQHVSASTQQ
eukprot:6467937-Amphidinium_carterae.1